MKKFLLACVVCLFSSNIAVANDRAEAAIKDRLTKVMPGVKDYKISRIAATGIYEVEFRDGFIYMTGDGKYALKGEIIDLHNNVNITEQKRSDGRLDVLAKIDASNMLIYPADKKRKYSVTIFTDIDCGYCRRLHQEMKDYNARGIEVKYVFYPRSGKNTPSYAKAVSVWCADDRHAAMNKAKSGQDIENRTCKNPVDQHMAAAKAVGVTGTPTIIMENGRRLPGYVKAAQLLAILDEQFAGR